MAQFRTTADILDLALMNAGEVTNGNSPYETEALNKLNRTHHALISGGTIALGKDMTVEIDEAWPWARARAPLVLELQPPFTTGFVTFTLGSATGTFTSAPTASLAGYHIAINGREEWFKIASHTAATLTFTLDGLYPDASVVGAFTALKLDYKLVAPYIVVNDENNKIQFQKTAGSTLTGTLTAGTYSPGDLATHVAAVMTTAASGPTITGAYSSVTRKFTLTSNGSGSTTLRIVGDGDQSAYSVHKTLGFDDESSTAGLTQTSTYILSGISRLIEPFKVHKGANEGRITGLDPESFMRDYPLNAIEEGVPDRFSVIREDTDGALEVRFNRYVAYKTRVEVDYVPVPRDLKDNSSSVPGVPRKHVDVLEDAATYFIMVLKSDDRAQVYANLVQGKLLAMVSQHRGQLFRIGENFARTIPRRDMLHEGRRPQLSYPTPTVTSTDVETVSTLVTSTVGYADFSIAATTKTVTFRTLAANRSLFAIIINIGTTFAGGAISALTLDAGTEADTDQFIAGFNIMQAAGTQESATLVFYPGVSTALTLTVTATGANLSALTQGALTIYTSEALT